jgi:hypothetical protein
MKILSLALLLVASMAFVLLGCSDKSAPIVAPNDQGMVSSSASSLAKGDVLYSATGGAHFFKIHGVKYKG